MENHDSRIAHPHEASTDERASFPTRSAEGDNGHAPPPAPPPEQPEPARPADARFATVEAEAAYWAGVRVGVETARAQQQNQPVRHRPPLLDPELTRDGAAASLTSSKLGPDLPGHPLPPTDPPGTRADGWTAEKQRIFIAFLADTGVVADACRASGMSRDAAYTFRRSARGRAFGLAWEAAQLIARGSLADEVLSRARNGVIDRVYRNGELVAERHRYDNRLTMSVLTRLDRQAEGLGENAPVIRAIAQEMDQFLDLLPEGNRAAEAFIANRFPDPAPQDEQSALGRAALYEEYGAGLPEEVSVGDLDLADMEFWTDDQLQRAELSGLLAGIPPRDWPDCARNGEADNTDGMCKLRKLYLRFNPLPAPRIRPEDFAGCTVWEDEDGLWYTDFPAPEGFAGYEESDEEGGDYRRSLSEAELALVTAQLQEEQAGEEAARAAARDRFFGSPSAPAPDPEDCAEEPPE